MTTKGKGTRVGDGDRELEDLAALLGSDGDGAAVSETAAAAKPADPAERAARLKTSAAVYEKAHTFRSGQLVQWKKGMKNRRHPEYGQPAVVIEVLDSPVYDASSRKGPGTQYFMEPLTLVAGWIDKDNDLLCFHYDGRRFEPFEEVA
jgi:hypothetical protein